MINIKNIYRNTTNADEYDYAEILDFCLNNKTDNAWISENFLSETDIIDYLDKNLTVSVYFWFDGKIESEEIRLV
tara:strand:- start:303 stop:527 length:225 start_codon:yes stop_codon:yes gene_type:complete